MTQPFILSACAEMLWPDKPIEWRVSRLAELGLGVGLWNWPAHDLGALERTGADFTIVNGYLRRRLADDEGAAELLATARETAEVGKRLGVARLNLHGTGLGDGGIPLVPTEAVTGTMWLKARDTLERIANLGAEMGVTFTLENLNPTDHPGCPFSSTSDVLALVSSVDRNELRINLDLYHTQLGEGDLIGWCRRRLPWIGEIQVAEVPGRCEPGTGEINFPAIARAERHGLPGPGRDGGFRGWRRGSGTRRVPQGVHNLICRAGGSAHRHRGPGFRTALVRRDTACYGRRCTPSGG